MKIKHERPDYVTRFVKPKNTEIKHINGRWYLYERATKYNPETGKSTKVSGKMLGTITEEGFVEKRGSRSPGEVVELGATQYFYEESSLMREKLKEFFPDVWREILSVTIITLVHEKSLRRCQTHYETSILSAIFPRLKLSPASLATLLSRIGRDQQNMRAFMLSLSETGEYRMAVDAHRLLSEEAAARVEVGTFALRTSQLELDPEQVYTIYKQKDAIDQLFTTFSCRSDLDATYMKGDYCEEGWLFLNHLSMMMGLDAIASLALTEEITFDDFIQGMRKIHAAKLEGKWYQAEIPKGVGSMCSLLGIELSPIGELIP